MVDCRCSTRRLTFTAARSITIRQCLQTVDGCMLTEVCSMAVLLYSLAGISLHSALGLHTALCSRTTHCTLLPHRTLLPHYTQLSQCTQLSHCCGWDTTLFCHTALNCHTGEACNMWEIDPAVRPKPAVLCATLIGGLLHTTHWLRTDCPLTAH